MNIFKIMKDFPNQEKCLEYLSKKRWGNTPICPYCNSKITHKHRKGYQCNKCHKDFTATVNTIFHNSHIELQKWFCIISMMLNAKKGISAYQVARDLNMRRTTAWSIMNRIRKVMNDINNSNNNSNNNKNNINTKLLKGIIEMDETYIGGKAENMHMNRRIEKKGIYNKEAIFGMLERNGKVIAKNVKNTTANTLLKEIYSNIEENSLLITDEAKVYKSIGNTYIHRTVNHSESQYVRDLNELKLYTNSIEGFWSLIKRGLIGQFHHISKKYLQKYVDEFCWRYNNKENNNMFSDLINNCVMIKN